MRWQAVMTRMIVRIWTRICRLILERCVYWEIEVLMFRYQHLVSDWFQLYLKRVDNG